MVRLLRAGESSLGWEWSMMSKFAQKYTYHVWKMNKK